MVPFPFAEMHTYWSSSLGRSVPSSLIRSLMLYLRRRSTAKSRLFIITWRNASCCLPKNIFFNTKEGGCPQITHDPLLFSVCARNILTVLRETLTQYITFNGGGGEGGGSLYSCSRYLATVLSCIRPFCENKNPRT
jgi:hypothetical protein